MPPSSPVGSAPVKSLTLPFNTESIARLSRTISADVAEVTVIADSIRPWSTESVTNEVAQS